MKDPNYQVAVRIAKVGSYLLLLSSSLNLVLYIQGNSSGLLVFYAGAKLLFAGSAIVFGRVRKNPRYYVAVFYEMNEVLYWYLVIAIMNAFSLVFVYFSTNLSPELQIIDASSIVLFFVLMIILYQTKPWTRGHQEQRLDRIRKLKRKARLSDREFALLAPVLTDHAEQKQKIPLSWRFAKWIMIIVLSILLNMYAGSLVDSLGRIDVLKPFLGH